MKAGLQNKVLLSSAYMCITPTETERPQEIQCYLPEIWWLLEDRVGGKDVTQEIYYCMAYQDDHDPEISVHLSDLL